IGLHTGERVGIKVRPAPPDTGICFVRTDLPGSPMIKASFENVVDTTLATTIGRNGCRVATIEHLMAAFFGLGVDNAVVEIDGPEVPIMDGSAAPFVFLLRSAGIKPQNKAKKFFVIKRPFHIEDGDRSVSISPSKELRIIYTINFNHPLLRDQTFDTTFSSKEFTKEISRARTFGFLKDVQALKKAGLAKGGSLDNAIVVDDFKILNEDGLRYEDEFVRHKILDFIGDLSILGAPVIGHFEVKRSGHFLNQEMLRKLMKSRDHWELVSLDIRRKQLALQVNAPSFALPEGVAL
ncbi:MAG TPA: UDP-3-O-acyl-N-acetylglucosamine deacetylase, partial [Desulfobacterales bacterium]|nr:UDP-3-O-acyl-N-acetylglucosamine deacetylase [Desulfobacterales bacterium]